MKVTIITATYNSEKFIELCLESVSSQNYSNIEHLIIDGGSKDNTLNLVGHRAKNNSKIKIFSEPDNGIYDALNKGILLSTGNLIGFLHSDDFFNSNNIISRVVQKIESDNLDGLYGDLNYVNRTDTTKIIRKWKSIDFKSTLLNKGWMPAHPTLFLKKEVYQTHGLFDLSYTISADYDFMVRIFKDSRLNFGYLNEVFTNMRVGGVSNRSLKSIIIKMKEDYKVIRENNIGKINTLILKNISKINQLLG